MTYELHPLCSLFPRLTGPEFSSLCDDIKTNGLDSPIVLHDGMILDGGNRYRACVEAGVEPTFVVFSGDDIVSFVLSANLHRRHLTTGQHAAIVSSVTNWSLAQGQGRPDKPATVAGLSTVAARAAQSGASDRTQRTADKVAKSDPALAVAVGHGKVTLAKAAEQVGEAPRSTKSAKPKKAAKPAKPEPDTSHLDDAYGDTDILAELEAAQKEIMRLNELLAEAEADDLKAETIKWRRAYENATQQQSAAMDNAARAQKREAWAVRQLQRCGKAVGETDPEKIAAVVEAVCRTKRFA